MNVKAVAMPHLILLGAPGSGKGTLAECFKKIGYKHISTGDLLRAEVRSGSQQGALIRQTIESGGLVSDETVFALITKNCDFLSNAYLLDGFPRTILQAKALVEILPNNYHAILLDASEELVIMRIANRRVCKSCGAIYNLKFMPPKISNICDKCGAKELIQRSDDQENVVLERLSVYQNSMSSVLDFFKSKSRLSVFDAGLDADTLYEQITRSVS